MIQNIYALVAIMTTFAIITAASFILDKKRQGAA